MKYIIQCGNEPRRQPNTQTQHPDRDSDSLTRKFMGHAGCFFRTADERMDSVAHFYTPSVPQYIYIYTNPAQIYTIYTLSALIRFTVGRGVLLPLSLICRYKLTKLKNPVLSSESPLASDFAVETQEDNLLFAERRAYI